MGVKRMSPVSVLVKLSENCTLSHGIVTFYNIYVQLAIETCVLTSEIVSHNLLATYICWQHTHSEKLLQRWEFQKGLYSELWKGLEKRVPTPVAQSLEDQEVLQSKKINSLN